ncbi:hypothetical protein [Rhodonellum sp.]|uniref:hypothetical protein n=1 Tax=Rhodonellum sp. TaxID=2231180 RepID=UPI002719012A|nr:hypothetical protein [Rhodonellum sp.]MDO9552802.1 hypothetical protein [Rhodonellum sp.]
MQKLTIISLFFILSGCFSGPLYESNLSFNAEEVVLKENLILISPPVSFAVLSDQSILVITESQQIIRFSPDGYQVQVIDNIGQGELEVYTPSLVRAYDDGFLIWCQDLLKMVEYNSNGQPIKAYFGFDHAIKDFEVEKNAIYTYISSLPGKPFVQVYDKISQKIAQSLGNAEKGQILTNLNACAGGMASSGSSLIFVPSHALELYQANINRIEEVKVTFLEHPAFKKIEFDADPVELINSDQMKAFGYGMENGLVTGIFSIEDKFLITGEVGEIKLTGAGLETNERKRFLMLLDSELSAEGLSFEDFDPAQSCRLYASGNDYLGRIIQKEGESEFTYVFEKLYPKKN